MVANVAGDVLLTPPDHTAYFVGSEPCDNTGVRLGKVINGAQAVQVFPDLRTDYYFSAKPPEGNYATYYEKVATYVELLSRWARMLDPKATARTHPTRSVVADDPEYPFAFMDDASSRAGITGLNATFLGMKVAILGLGGTGSHILDRLSKIPVAELHLYDGDTFVNHNAFRAPGASSIDDVQTRSNKAERWAAVYSAIKRGVIAHPHYFEPQHVEELVGFDFVFLALDDGSDRAGIAAELEKHDLSFIDMGMGVTDSGAGLTGILRVSTSTPSHRAAIPEGGTAPDEYARNIQINPLNALNADLAIVHWMRTLGFFANMAPDMPSFAYPVSDNRINELAA
jgi:hypothetical protein